MSEAAAIDALRNAGPFNNEYMGDRPAWIATNRVVLYRHWKERWGETDGDFLAFAREEYRIEIERIWGNP